MGRPDATLEVPPISGPDRSAGGHGTADGSTATAVSDAELTALALAADPDAPLPPDAVPFRGDDDPGDRLLPEWYMPGTVRAGRRTPARTVAAVAVVTGLVLINVLGLCITYGTLTAG
ncbi:MAG: hypothetical protein KDB10_14760 [Acidimicrobiales bacterium]|nr:hypothetical protein [Acidimicrobiales bacterium]MCB9372950.1 hypothetical protein [Microthrixaceae bacterium]